MASGGNPDLPGTHDGERDEPLYREMVRENERILDRQYQNLERAEKKNDTAFKLGALSFVFGLSLAASRLRESPRIDLPASIEILVDVLLIGSMVCHMVAFFLLGQSQFSLAGSSHGFREAPREDWVTRSMKKADHRLEEHLGAVVLGLAQAIKINTQLRVRTTFQRRNSMRVLAAGFLGHVLTALVIYIAHQWW